MQTTEPKTTEPIQANGFQRTKDVEIAGVRYRIDQFTARTGSWVLKQVLGNMFSIGERDFENLQTYCLNACSKYYGVHAAPLPISLQDGRLPPDLEYDLVTVALLTKEVLEFNLRPFFENPAVSAALESAGLRLNRLSSLI